MRFAVDVAPLGDLADPRATMRLAVAAEAAGWDGISTWGSLGVSMGAPAADPFVVLSAVAGATRRLRLIASVIVLPRRRPQLVAQAAASLDVLSDGRLILGVGAGADPGDFEPFGDEFGSATRIQRLRLDAAVEIVDGFLRGERVTRTDGSFDVRDASVGLRPLQRPRPPIWLGGHRPGALRRAAGLDGWIAVSLAEDGVTLALGPEAFGESLGRILAERARLGLAGSAFDVALFGQAGAAGIDVARYEEAGASWWLESVSPMRGPLDDLLAVVEAGPAR